MKYLGRIGKMAQKGESPYTTGTGPRGGGYSDIFIHT